MEQDNQQTYFPLVEMGEETENACLHFTKAKNVESISQEGLYPVIGGYSKGCEKTPKVFFSKGHEGILLNADVWMKYFMNKAYGYKNQFGLFPIVYGQDRERVIDGIQAWDHEFTSREFLQDELKKHLLYEKLYQAMQRHVYLVLSLEPGVDYNPNDIDEVKQSAIEQYQTGKGINIKYAEIMYGHQIDNPIMEGWNMHTPSNQGVAPEKIAQLVTKSGQTDMLSIIEQAYATRDKSKKYDMLDEYMSYVAKRREEDSRGNKKSEEAAIAEIVMTYGTQEQLKNYRESIISQREKDKDQATHAQELSTMQEEQSSTSTHTNVQQESQVHQPNHAPQKTIGTHPSFSSSTSSNNSSSGFVNTLPLMLSIFFLGLTGIILYIILK